MSRVDLDDEEEITEVTTKQLFDMLYQADADKNMVGKVFRVVEKEETQK